MGGVTTGGGAAEAGACVWSSNSLCCEANDLLPPHVIAAVV